MSKSGKVQHFAEGSSQGARGGGGAKAAIPEEALPSGESLDRQLEAVTISESEFRSYVEAYIAVATATNL